jgi:predicted extracellular nuclease
MKKISFFFATVTLAVLISGYYYAQSSSVKMNEIYSRGTDAAPDWIELYNNSSSSIDISNYKIYDSGGKGGTKDKKGFAASTIIAAYGYYVVTTDGSSATDFGLSNNGEEVWLEDGSGTIVDDVVFPALESGQCYARVPDGESWQVLTAQTKGTSNSTATAIQNEKSLLTAYTLNQNYPNPFNPSTMISFSIQKESQVKLEVLNLLGQNVATLISGRYSQGSYKTTWNAGSFSAGVYFCRIIISNSEDGSSSSTKKMLLLK